MKAAMEKEEKEKKIDKATEDQVEEQDLEDNKEIQEDKEMKDSQDTEEVAEKPSTKSFLKGSKNKELAAKEDKINDLSDRLMRTMAEFDNFRKRSEKEKSQMFDLGVKSVLEKLLPVIDNFERGLESIAEEDKDNSFVQGFNMIYKQLMTTMDEIGVKAIEAVGNEFDPNFHNAVMHGEDETLGENIVAEEFQKGYLYNGVVIRHSMVRVVN
ncbi:MAG: nucleotide exchange factor GrpE [Clostridiales bacterium]|nr:nucleotide exchange factor GrpE [Clostridiales bacterium]